MSSTDAMVYVVDDDPALREGLASLIRAMGLQPRTFATGADFLAFGRPDVPSCLVLDVRLPGLSGLDLQSTLGGSAASPPIIFISGHGDIPMSVRAMKAGAVEFLPKPFEEGQLVAAIEEALTRDRAARERRAELAAAEERCGLLSAREREVAACVVRGLLNKQIAAELGITEVTVKVHRRHIMRKLQVRSVPDLVRAMSAGFPGADPEEMR
jgi:FixJ family two-component response regulator